jgi:catechol 2,3-dioxygenase-like lactoylglutathione lyase family enzyme
MTNVPPPSSILETALSVTDLARSREFYSRLLGYPLITADDRFCAFRAGERQVFLLFLRGSDPQGTQLPFGFIPAHGTTGQGHVAFGISKASALKANSPGRSVERAFISATPTVTCSNSLHPVSGAMVSRSSQSRLTK